MRRKIYDKLIIWKNKKEKKPLLIIGARQVGKTHIVKEFCNKEYKNVIIFDLFQESSIVDLFKERISSEEKYKTLKTIIGLDIDIENDDTIIFFDEIQESEELIAALKFFNEEHPNVNIICAGSLLGVKLKRLSLSFPVGKAEMINMYPMNFEEFLLAFNQDLLLENIKESYKKNKPLVKALHDTALLYYRYYLCVGGMPESVLSLVKSERDISNYDTSILDNIIEAYFNDMSKYIINKSESLKIKNIYKSVPSQLASETNKFRFSKITANARKRDYETALDWLLASRLLISSNKVKVPEIPLKGFISDDHFKLFLSDIGILRQMLNIRFSDILTDNLSLYKGAIIENYVANELVANNIPLFYWSSSGIAEIDFLLYKSEGIIPIEVKAGDSVKSKSLKVYNDKYNPKYSIRISLKNFGFVNNIKSVPLYAVFCIQED